MGAVSAPEVQKTVHASGDVNVGARTLLAGRYGLAVNASFDGSILGGHDVLGGKLIIYEPCPATIAHQY
jgi:hypothetical protein